MGGAAGLLFTQLCQNSPLRGHLLPPPGVKASLPLPTAPPTVHALKLLPKAPQPAQRETVGASGARVPLWTSCQLASYGSEQQVPALFPVPPPLPKPVFQERATTSPICLGLRVPGGRTLRPQPGTLQPGRVGVLMRRQGPPPANPLPRAKSREFCPGVGVRTRQWAPSHPGKLLQPQTTSL